MKGELEKKQRNEDIEVNKVKLRRLEREREMRTDNDRKKER